jgi:N-acetylmuramic acid-specific PTS system IIC component
MDYNKIAIELVKFAGGEENIVTYTNCMTRLRITVRDKSAVNLDELKKVEGVLGVNENGDELQLIYGTGKVTKAREAMDVVLGGGREMTIEEIAEIEKNKVKGSRNEKVQAFFSKFSNIFVPLIPGFIAAGLLAGFASLFATLQPAVPGTLYGDILVYMKLFNDILMKYLYVMVGYNAAKSFGGSGVLGAIMAGFFLIDPTKINPGTDQQGFLFGVEVIVKGGMIGALISSITIAKVEKFVRKFVPDAADLIITPSVSLLITGIFTLLIVMPISAVLYDGMNWMFINLSQSAIGTAILAGTFLGAVLLGIHQGFVPVYEGLVQTVGYNTLFPVLAMAGAGQVGAAIAVYKKAKPGSATRRVIGGAIIPGFLGVGEPLIYGVTLPRVKPFFTAAAGGAVGGFYIGLISNQIGTFGLNTVFGPSGLVALPLMTSATGPIYAILAYASALVVAYIAGFVFTWFFGTKNIDLS